MGNLKMLSTAVIAVIMAAALLVSCEKKQLEPESKEVFGSICMVNLYESGTEKLYEAIFSRLEEIESGFSTDEKAKEISSRVFQIGNESKKYTSMKGFAMEEIKKMTKKSHAECFIVNLNGKVFLQGEKRDKTPWKVGIKNPSNPSGMSIAIITGLTDTAIMTNAEFAGELQTGTKYPSVTVISPDSIYADTCSSYVFDMLNKSGDTRRDKSAEEKIEEICEKLRRLEDKIVIVDYNGRIFASKELEGYIGASLDDYEIVFK